MTAENIDMNQIMKNFNITKKYFKEIYAYVWCNICREIVSVPINNQEINDGLKSGLYMHTYHHTNPLYDPENPMDKSNNIHTCLIYIDRKYDVRGVRTFQGKEMSSDELEKGSKVPIVVKEISRMSLQLGMITQDEYNILKLCDGHNTVEDVAEIADISSEALQKAINELKKKRLINIIIRC